MKIFIITMDDPVETNKFIKNIIKNWKTEVVGLAVPNGDRLTIGKNKSKFVYVISLLFIMGIPYFFENSLKTVFHKIKVKLSKYGLLKSPDILSWAKRNDIKTFKIKSPNSKKFLNILKSKDIDVIINQSQCILKDDLLNTPKIGVINRHNALLPKNRGRLTPFWILFNGEKETGVSIHFVEKSLDSGDIIIQKRFPVDQNESFKSLIKKNYTYAPIAMHEALIKLKNGENHFIENNDELATYNTIPTFKQALIYRFSKFTKIMKRS